MTNVKLLTKDEERRIAVSIAKCRLTQFQFQLLARRSP
jgi:hypothetical protein